MARVRPAVRQIVSLASHCETLRKLIKQTTMCYQYDLKVEAARYFGLPFCIVDVDFEAWSKIRDKYLKALERERNQ